MAFGTQLFVVGLYGFAPKVRVLVLVSTLGPSVILRHTCGCNPVARRPLSQHSLIQSRKSKRWSPPRGTPQNPVKMRSNPIFCSGEKVHQINVESLRKCIAMYHSFNESKAMRRVMANLTCDGTPSIYSPICCQKNRCTHFHKLRTFSQSSSPPKQGDQNPWGVRPPKVIIPQMVP